MTSLLAVTASGDLLPPQLLYQGKTAQCHPSVDFPNEWDVYHSPNHWANSETMLRYIDTVILPYVNKQRSVLNKPDKAALCIFDVFRAHQSEALLQKLKDNNIWYVFVPASCTGELQPLDISVNKVYKEKLKAKFEQWYSEQVEVELNSGVDVMQSKVNLNLSLMKPIHAQWLIKIHEEVAEMAHIIRLGFVKAGIIHDRSSDDTLPPSSDSSPSRSACTVAPLVRIDDSD